MLLPAVLLRRDAEPWRFVITWVRTHLSSLQLSRRKIHGPAASANQSLTLIVGSLLLWKRSAWVVLAFGALWRRREIEWVIIAVSKNEVEKKNEEEEGSKRRSDGSKFRVKGEDNEKDVSLIYKWQMESIFNRTS